MHFGRCERKNNVPGTSCAIFITLILVLIFKIQAREKEVDCTAAALRPVAGVGAVGTGRPWSGPSEVGRPPVSLGPDSLGRRGVSKPL